MGQSANSIVDKWSVVVSQTVVQQHGREELIIRMASENRDSGYDRIAGAPANLGHEISAPRC